MNKEIEKVMDAVAKQMAAVQDLINKSRLLADEDTVSKLNSAYLQLNNAYNILDFLMDKT